MINKNLLSKYTAYVTDLGDNIIQMISIVPYFEKEWYVKQKLKGVVDRQKLKQMHFGKFGTKFQSRCDLTWSLVHEKVFKRCGSWEWFS